MFALFAGDHVVRTRRDEGLQGTHYSLEGAQQLLTETLPNAAWAHVVNLEDERLPVVAVYGWGGPRLWAPLPGRGLSLEELADRLRQHQS